jgi:hypothetical protein
VGSALGDEFMAPDLTHSPGTAYRADFVSCSYTGKLMTVEVKKWQYPDELGLAQSLQAVQIRYSAATTNIKSTEIADLGDHAWFYGDTLDVRQGSTRYVFAAYPTAPEAYQINRQDKLTALAKLYLSHK